MRIWKKLFGDKIQTRLYRRDSPRGLWLQYQQTGEIVDLERAIEALEQAIEQSTPNSPDLPFYLDSLGLGRMRRYRLTGEVTDLERAIEASEQLVEQSTPNSRDLPTYLNSLTVRLLQRYRLTGEVTDLERAIEASEQAVDQSPPDSPDLPNYMHNLAAGLVARYQQTGKLADLERAIEASEQAVDQSPPGYPFLSAHLLELGDGLRHRFLRTGEMADLERAIEAFEQATQQSSLDYPTLATPNAVTSLVILAVGLMERYQLTGEVTDLERAIEASEQAVDQSPADSPDLQFYLDSLGRGLMERYQRTGEMADLERAIEAFEQANEQPPSPNYFLYLPFRLNMLAAALMERHQQTGEVADLERAIEASEQAVDQSPPDSPSLVDYLYSLGVRLMERYQRTGDQADLDQLIDIWERAWSLLQTSYAMSSVVYKIGQQSESAALPTQLISAHLKQAQVTPSEAGAARRRALEIAEGSKSRLLMELIGRADVPVPPGVLSDLVDRERQLLAELTDLDTAELASSGTSYISQAEAGRYARLQQRQQLLQELEDLWTRMSEASHEAAEYVALRRGAPLSWEDIARLAADLGAETALVSFFIVENRALLFIVHAGWEEPALVETDIDELAGIKIMRRLFREIHTSDGSTHRGETWHRPLKTLLEKAKPHLGGVTHIVFAPHLWGHLIPWSVVAERAGWRNRDQRIVSLVTLPALGLLSRLRDRPSLRDGSALVAGNPLGDLEYAEEEAREVAAMLGTTPLLGSQARKPMVQASLSKAQVVHLATHAYFDPYAPWDSGVVLADEEILTAREVMDERLRADLLILSACETGLTQALGGDELAGLGQAFIQGGARSVIVSLWRVDDSSTAALMKAFYDARRGGADKAQALSQAITQVQAQEKWHHPYYWGAFVFMGDW